jgi:hypothetical protein
MSYKVALVTCTEETNLKHERIVTAEGSEVVGPGYSMPISIAEQEAMGEARQGLGRMKTPVPRTRDIIVGCADPGGGGAAMRKRKREKRVSQCIIDQTRPVMQSRSLQKGYPLLVGVQGVTARRNDADCRRWVEGV